jgi:NitT/TauT family transport system ATP-binding protein
MPPLVGEPPSSFVSGATPSRSLAAVVLDHVQFSYGSQVVLEDISARILPGSIVGIVGPSGCGKSTLLGVVSGLLRPDRGTVELNLDSGRHPLSMVFQRDTLLPWLTVAENVQLFTRFRKHGRRQTIPRLSNRRLSTLRKSEQFDARLDELLAIVGLTGSEAKYPYQLSGGMRRRLAFLVAVAADPELLLLDEPFSSVDEPTRIGIHQDVFRTTKLMKMTTILVTHDLAEAVSLCDRIFILRMTPSVVVHTHEIAFGDDRRMLELRETPEFLAAYARVWHDLSQEIAKGQENEAEEVAE